MRIRRLAVVVVTLAAASLAQAGTATAQPALLTYEQIAALPSDTQAAILDPLRRVANAANTVGKKLWTSIYSGLQIDAPRRIVTIYLTDPDLKAGFLAAVRSEDPNADLRLASFARGGFTFASLTAASDAVMRQQQREDLTIESVVVPSDGSGVLVRVFDLTLAKQGLTRFATSEGALVGSIPIVLEPAKIGSEASRLRDTPQWIAGAALAKVDTSQADAYWCTSGPPARRNSDGRSFLITAAHCFADGATVYTGWQNGLRNRVGVVALRDTYDDAVAIDTSSTGTTAGREWDGPQPNGPYQVLAVTGSAFSFDGDMACQDGFTLGIVCGLLVDHSSITWVAASGEHRGVEAHQVNGRQATRGGDSGSLVFALRSGNIREARGVDSFAGGNSMRWTEVPFIFATFGMSLAP